MLMPSRPRLRRARSTLRTSASTPSLLKPRRLITALCSRQAEHARLRVARLRPRRDRADLDEAEAQRQQRIDVRAVLVQAGGQADRVGEGQAEGLGRQRRRRSRQQRIEAGAVGRLHRLQAEPVRALGIEGEQEGAGESVHAVRRRRTSQARPPKNSRTTTIASTRRCTASPAQHQPGDGQAVAVERPALRRISPRAMCPVTIATMLPSNGSRVQPRMPETRLMMASGAGLSIGRIHAAVSCARPQRSNLMPCASGSESE